MSDEDAPNNTVPTGDAQQIIDGAEPERHLALRAGWFSAAAAPIVAVIAAVAVATSATNVIWLANRATIAGVVILTLGVLSGSERVVGLASLPFLAGAIAGSRPEDSAAWTAPLIIGVLWYLATELAWHSIEQRDGVVRTAAIKRGRRQEIATVVIVALLVGLGGALLGTYAPTRTLFLRIVLIGSVLAAMGIAVRQMSETAPDADNPGD